MNQTARDYVNLLSQLSFQVISCEDDQILREKQRQARQIFTNEVGHLLQPKRVYLHFKKIAEEVGAPEAKVHDLRHTYAVLSLQNGDDVKTVQMNLGHASAAFTLDVYGHVSDRMQRESAARMEQYIADVSRMEPKKSE